MSDGDARVAVASGLVGRDYGSGGQRCGGLPELAATVDGKGHPADLAGQVLIVHAVGNGQSIRNTTAEVIKGRVGSVAGKRVRGQHPLDGVG